MLGTNNCDLSRENHTNRYPFEPFKPFTCRLSAVQERHEAVRSAVITRSKQICIRSEKKVIRSNGCRLRFKKNLHPFERLMLSVWKKNELPAHPFQNDYRNSSHMNGYRKSSSLLAGGFAVDLFLFLFAHHAICICSYVSNRSHDWLSKVCCVTNNCLYENFSKFLKLCFGGPG